MKKLLAVVLMVIILGAGMAPCAQADMTSTLKLVVDMYDDMLNAYCVVYNGGGVKMFDEMMLELAYRYYVVRQETNLLYLLEQESSLGNKLFGDTISETTEALLNVLKGKWDEYKNGELGFEQMAEKLFSVIEVSVGGK